jgi:hypothetical protein
MSISDGTPPSDALWAMMTRTAVLAVFIEGIAR